MEGGRKWRLMRFIGFVILVLDFLLDDLLEE